MPLFDLYNVTGTPAPRIREEPRMQPMPAQTLEPQKSGRWVTIFGFSRPEVSMVLSEFRTVGELTDKRFGPGEANWIHLQFKDQFQAQRAFLKNATRLPGTQTMIGVVPYDDSQSKATELPSIYKDPFIQKQLQETVHVEVCVVPGMGPQPITAWRSFLDYVVGV